MLDTIGAFGSGIGTNLLSDSLSKKLEAFKDKKAIASFTQSLRDWEIEFEKQNDGTIITNGAFYSHVKYHNVIENIVAYVLEPSMNAVTEDEFLNCLHEKMVNRIEETTEKKLSWNDSRLIRNFLTHLLTTTRAFLFQKISLEDRGLFYLVCQNNAKLEHLERIVKEKFQMQDQNVQQIVEQLSMAIQKSETEERIKAKMASWNSRQIKNLGNRYTPDLNIPVEIMDSLHGASVDQQFQNIFYDKVDKFLIAMRHTELSEINALCDAIEKYAIPIFDELYSNHDSALYRLVEWGLVHASKQAITDDIAESCAIILSWLLISPNNELRDKATKAIIYILNSHMPALLFLMRIFEEIDDPYISERIYAVAFGCVVNEDSPQQVRALAEHVYKNIFDKDVVYPNILLRTYAKNIIDYARHIGCVEDGYFDAEKITPPYNSRFPEIPSDEEIKTYKLDYNSESFRDYHWSQLAILNSMKVEYSRSGQPGGYGDFGRYTFQSYFYAWKQLHPIDLKNIAIKRIFELGYDVEKHGKYDRNCTDRVGLRFQLGRKERIGKKYQWIALYELAAQVCDNYQMTVYDNDIGEPHQEYCKGSFEPDIRNIDPTVLVTPGFDNLHIDIAAFSYDIPNNSYEEWLADFSNTPAFEQCVKLQSGAHQYLLLTGEYDWKEAKRLGFRSYDLPRKDMWHQIRGYVVKNEYAESLICALSGVDFMGRWMPEAQSNSAMYNKEYYWSDAHTFFNNPYYCGLEWVNIDSDHLNCVFPEKVLIPVKQYYSERKGELNSLNSEIASIYWHKPCEEMYTKLQLKYLKGSNSAFVDGAGELVCFESSELIGNDTGFYIRYDKLLEFLKSSSYTLVWTSLCEKRILTPSFGKWDLPPKAIHMSSVYYLKDGKIAKASETLFEDRLYY